jgi:hypothetical protein
MGYEIHIVKTKDWFHADSNPITKAEIDKIITVDKDLSFSQTDYVEFIDQNNGTVRSYAILWKNTPFLYWNGNEIVCKSANEEQIVKLIEISDLLQAFVIGDDGERYKVQKTFFGRKKLIIE